MEQQRYFITPDGRDSLKKELAKLQQDDRPQIIQAIAEARAYGDLSENAEYHSAKEKQGMIEAKISYLKGVLSLGEVIDVSQLDGAIKFGARVSLEDDVSGETIEYQLVDDPEVDIEKNKLSIKTPLGRALIGKDVDDEVVIRAPGGKRRYTILKVSYF
ncbi:MAG: transcription elongation factor GreA [Rhodobacteraceae bacterium]|nr:transcription elongation factor GreA [Paracoccaceae bacterium]